jgi:hypothetical protein
MFISIEEQSQIDIAQIYKAIGAAFGLGFLGPFCISTVCALMNNDWGVNAARQWTMLGVILIPIFAFILVIVYLLTGYHIVPYIPPP